MNAAIIALASSITVAVIGGIVAIITTSINARNEKAKASHIAAAEAHQAELDVKDERITLRDEQLADCERDKEGLVAKLDYYRARVRELEQGR